MRSFHLVNELSKYHEIDMLAFNQSRLLGAYFDTVNDGLRAAESYFQRILGRMEICAIPSERGVYGKERLALRSLFSHYPYSINWLISREFNRSLKRFIATKQYDAVHFDTISLAPYRDVVGDLPCILDHHNVESHMLLRRAENESNALRRLYYLQEGRRLLAYERRHLRKFALHIVCSEDDKCRLQSIDANIEVEVVPNGISLDEQAPQRSDAQEKRLLFVGGMSWYPNLDAMHFFLDKVWPILVKVDPDISIDIVGRAPSERMLQHAQSDRRIRIHGFVDDIQEFYRRASVYVCPIMDGGGTKLKILDALAHRVPLVAHSIACEGIDLVPHVHGLVADSPEKMADSILTLLSDHVSAQRLGDQGYQLIKEKYDFRSIGAHFANSLAVLG